ncbi:recombinase family protein [Streptomyces sp. NBC_01515]|uniref:recombinase family protein n=1 Tax=Streptomyces sp. NBC_01515 TaxID=2903890 RepID=UPI00387071EC
MKKTGPLIGREYRRLSNAKGGTSLARQGADNARAAAENDISLQGEPYIDDGLSASRYAKKRRDDFEKLVGDIASGPTGLESRFGANVLMLWESSRGSRKVGEWASFIDLLEEKQVLIWVTTHERMYDPSNGRDRKSLLEDAVDSEYESYKTHVRTYGTAAYQATIGHPHAAPPDGLMPVYDATTGDLVDWVENPERSEPFRELFRLLEKGHSVTDIERRFEKAGYLNLSGRPFSREHLRQSATRHAYAGLRLYRGQVYDGIWTGFVPVARFWAVQQILNAPDRRTTRTGRATHVLTGNMWCGRCDGPITKVKHDVAYQCTGCWLRIQKAPVDDLVIGGEVVNEDKTVTPRPGTLLRYLARKDLYKLLARSDGDDEELRSVQNQLAQARTERDMFRQAKAATVAQALIFANSLEEKEAEVQQLESRERSLSLPPAVLNMIRPGVNVWESWHEAPVTARRDVARIVLQPGLLGRLYVHPSPRRGRYQPILERLEYRRTG